VVNFISQSSQNGIGLVEISFCLGILSQVTGFPISKLFLDFGQNIGLHVKERITNHFKAVTFVDVVQIDDQIESNMNCSSSVHAKLNPLSYYSLILSMGDSKTWQTHRRKSIPLSIHILKRSDFSSADLRDDPVLY
jgi:hypothetical protein